MNKTYRTVWNATTGTWTAAAETARSRSKSNSNAKSAIATAVAMMAGVGGAAVSFDAQAQAAANGAGGLNLCGPTGGANGVTFGSGALTGTSLTAACTANPSRLSLNHPMAFQLYNNTTSTGSGMGQPSAATEVGIGGSKDGHLMLLGGSGVHIQGPVDFDNNVNLTNHRINNLAAGVAGTDAVNVSQLNAAIAATDNRYVVTNTGTYAAATPAQAGSSATAVGANANATGQSAVALGGNTVATGQNGVAIGTMSRATGLESTAVGVGANASGTNTTALGRGAAATANNSVALGTFSTADRANSVSVGTATAQRQVVNVAAGTAATDAVNLGQMNTALAPKLDNTVIKVGGTTAAATSGNTSNIAIGSGATSYADPQNSPAIAMGWNSNANGAGAVAIGSNSTASATEAIALGLRSTSSGANAVTLGGDAKATEQNSVALGYGSLADRANAVSVGSSTLQRQITNVAAGTAATDAVNLAQLNAALAGTTANPYVKVNGVTADATAIASGAIAIGGNATADATGAAHRAVAIGQNASAIGNSLAVGGNANAVSRAVAIGGGTTANVNGATAVGYLASSTADSATALGYGARAGNAKSLALGAGANVQNDGSVALGADASTDRDNSVSVGSSTLQRQITNVAAGTQTTDAVNVGQLKDSGLIGGDGKAIAAVTYDRNTDGSPNYGSVTLGDGNGPVKVTNVADATGDSDALNLGQLKQSGLVGDDGQGNLTSLAVTYDDASKDKATLAGANGTTLSNVKAGVADLDAVNVSQLKDSGLIGGDGKAIAAVTYDRNPDGSPNYGSVTLGDGNGPVKVTNVADATGDSDALNLGQLKQSGLVGDDGQGNLTSLAVTYDDATKAGVTLGNAGTPVAVHNVADGVLSA
ncbi:ESPR-type extended signal peptide-containing protein, partial [Burkholderia sp. IT-111MI5]|uniref:ESPR-type extended signal peptide-containing protein n=1 Tax=Burkholderia sp. IT-111MI5 TaxID=3026439 RepID=UPI0039E0EFE9